MSYKTVGEASRDLQIKNINNYDPIRIREIKDEALKDVPGQLMLCIEDGKKLWPHDFFVLMIFRNEQTMWNVKRKQFRAKETCPTPTFDQNVYWYHKQEDRLEYLWTIPDRDTCNKYIAAPDQVDPQEKELLQFVLDFRSGELDRRCAKINEALKL